MKHAAIVLLLVSICLLRGRDEHLNRWVIDAGGGIASSSTHRLICAIGQPVIGLSCCPGNYLHSGFLCGCWVEVGIAEPPQPSNLTPAISLIGGSPSITHLTRFSVDIPETKLVRLTIYDITGRHVIRIHEGDMTPGTHKVIWDNQNGPGVYFCRMEAGDYSTCLKLVVIKD